MPTFLQNYKVNKSTLLSMQKGKFYHKAVCSVNFQDLLTLGTPWGKMEVKVTRSLCGPPKYEGFYLKCESGIINHLTKVKSVDTPCKV